MRKFTCKDCNWFDSTPGRKVGFCKHYNTAFDACDEFCVNFVTTDGKRPRFCRLASSVDEMAKATVQSVFEDGKLRYIVGFELSMGRYTTYNTKEEAIVVAKKLLMENENK